MQFGRDKDGTIHKIVKTTMSGLDTMYKCRGKKNKMYFLRDDFMKFVKDSFEEVLMPRDILVHKKLPNRVLVIKYISNKDNELTIHTTDGDYFGGKYVTETFNLVTRQYYTRQIQKK